MFDMANKFLQLAIAPWKLFRRWTIWSLHHFLNTWRAASLINWVSPDDCFVQLLTTASLKALQAKITMDDTHHGRLRQTGLIGNVWNDETGWSSWFNTNSFTADTLSSVRAIFGLPLPRFCSVLPVPSSFFSSVSSPPFVQFFIGNSANNLHET